MQLAPLVGHGRPVDPNVGPVGTKGFTWCLRNSELSPGDMLPPLEKCTSLNTVQSVNSEGGGNYWASRVDELLGGSWNLVRMLQLVTTDGPVADLLIIFEDFFKVMRGYPTG